MRGVASFGDALSQAHSPWNRLRSFWRTEMRERFRAVRPVAVVAVAAAVLVFGTIGFNQYNPDFSLADSLYRALQLFGFGATVDPGEEGIPMALEIARFLGPLVIGYAALRGILVLFREQLQILGFRLRLKNHVVVCGLGSAGSRLATAFQAQGFRVVAIEKDPNAPGIALCRQRGIGVLKDDARDHDALNRARVTSARMLVVTCGDDGTSVDVTTSARKVAITRPDVPLTALVELEDIDLWDVLRARAVVDRDHGGFRLEVFNVCASGAETLLEEHPPLPDRQHGEPLQPHVLLIGLYGVAESVVLKLAKTWQNRQKDAGDKLTVTIADPDATGEVERLKRAHPELVGIEACEITPCDLEIDPGWITDAIGKLPVPVTSAYVCLEQESQALATALCIERLASLGDAPVIVPLMEKSPGVANMLPPEDHALQRVHVFPVFSRSLTPESLLRSTTTELIARQAHELRVRDQAARGVTADDDPSLAPWDRLQESLKRSKRHQAEEVTARLDKLGRTLVPAGFADPASSAAAPLSDEEVERLAQSAQEQQRRRFSRKRPAVPGDDGSEDARVIPEALARVGFEVAPAPTRPPTAVGDDR